jgi:L-aminopeptidase/D-esterase-like protein
MPGALGFGFEVGHWTDPRGATGCTVVLPPAGNVSSCDVRGSSPGSRELPVLDTDRRLTEIHGVLLTGGSAFGLAAADGVMRWLAEHGIGYRTPVATVPIVPAAVIFDLGTGATPPGPDAGYAACENAASERVLSGRVGAGTGATAGKWAGLEFRVPGGLGFGSAAEDGHEVTALAVVNPVGDVIAPDGRVLAGTSSPNPKYRSAPAAVPTNTVLAVVATAAALDKRAVRWLAARGSDGVTKSVRPAHTLYDGDVTFAVASPDPSATGPARLDLLGVLATDAVADAVRNAVVT